MKQNAELIMGLTSTDNQLPRSHCKTMNVTNFITRFQTTHLAVGALLGCICCLFPIEGVSAVDFSPLSPFGIGTCYQRSGDLTNWLPPMIKIGITNLRACRSGFGDVEPAEGKWRWDKLDNDLRYAAANHIELFALLNGKGKWNTKDLPKTLPINNLPAWSTYVRETVKHANGRIRYWEVWNEPPNGTSDAPASDYAKVVVAAYDAAKASDPSCRVGLAAKSVDLNYLDQAIKTGAKDHFDYLTLHPYEVLGCALNRVGTEPVFMSIVPTARKMLAATNPSKANVPIIFTELGCNAAKLGVAVHAQALVKAYTMGIAQGVACINWFEGMDGDSGPMGLLQADGTPRPAYTAMAQMIQHLGQYPQYLGWVLLNDKDYGFVFQGAKSTVLITWAPKGATNEVDFGQTVQIVDPMTGNTTTNKTRLLTTAPIFVIGVPAELSKQAQSNKAKPFPWGGDYTSAKSVSVTFGDKTVENGLHTHAGEAIAADVITYGGSARVGNVPGGNVYMVDPNFLSYTTTPIQITAVVRRNPANDPAELDLEYESTTGYKKAPMYEIPDNTEWHNATWTIDDSQFVSKYGFNFRFDAGTYYIQSVTVTKLAR